MKPCRLASAAILAIVMAIPGTGGAQGATAVISGRIALVPDSLTVSVLTIGPGEQLFDRFGHAAIRVRRASTGLDSAWNWGMYDFEAPNFIGRFLTGDTQYWMAGYPTPLVVDFYRRAGRAVWEQELALTRVQSDSLLSFLRWNARDENKFYRYDYYLDNCSTRIRDAIDLVLGGALRAPLTESRTAVSWRTETLRLSEAFPFIAFGMTFALGRPADETLTLWDDAFVPMRLRDALHNVQVNRPGVGMAPLVHNERTLNEAGDFVDAKEAPSYVAFAALLGVALAILIAGAARSAGTSVAARLALQGFGSLWHLTLGIAGTLVVLAALFTRHQFMAANASVLLGTPVSLALVVLYARAWSPSAGPRTVRAGEGLAVFAAVCAAVALLAHLIPGVGPGDWAPVALVLPVHVALARALRAYRRATARPVQA